ncbi:virginiamycin B lyase family protein [Streptomyces sp. NPDC003996]
MTPSWPAVRANLPACRTALARGRRRGPRATYSHRIDRGVRPCGRSWSESDTPSIPAAPLRPDPPDGLIWYADSSGRVGRITARGTITTFRVPDGAARVPFRVATGPDRAVWFTELIGNAIGRVRPMRG